MSAAVVHIRGVVSIEDLEQQIAEVDAEITDALAKLAEGSASDEDVAELRRRRVRLEDRIAGAKTLAARAAERARAEEREQDERALAEATREVDDEAIEAARARWGALATEAFRILLALDDAITSDMQRAAVAIGKISDLETRLGIAKHATNVSAWTRRGAALSAGGLATSARIEEGATRATILFDERRALDLARLLFGQPSDRELVGY